MSTYSDYFSDTAAAYASFRLRYPAELFGGSLGTLRATCMPGTAERGVARPLSFSPGTSVK